LLVTSGAYPRRKHLKGTLIGLALALPSSSKTWLERVSKAKPSSLLGLVISEKGKKFNNIDLMETSSEKTIERSPLKMANAKFIPMM
jgi:hypothetical protein